jgi:predicted DNA-binding protein (MmcQ/YjbR family)
MPKSDPILSKVRQICLALPDTKETITWGKPHFRVGDKIFAGYGAEDGRTSIGCKLEMQHAAALVKLPGFAKAPYVGHKGWVSIDPAVASDWDHLRELIHESYRLIAPKKSLAKWTTDGNAPPIRQTTTETRRHGEEKKPAKKRAEAKKTPKRPSA